MDDSSKMTSKVHNPEVLTAAQVREIRRRNRLAERSEVERGVRVLKRAVRHLERGKPSKAVETVLSGFGGLMLGKLLETLRKKGQ